MTYKDIILKIQKELPLQIDILKKEYRKIENIVAYNEKMTGLESYRQRMIRGLDFLNSIEDEEIIGYINSILSAPKELTDNNKKRYLGSLEKYRNEHKITITEEGIQKLVNTLKELPLIHTTKNPERTKKYGIKAASELWLTPYKSCANAMDIILGLDRYVFLTHGFGLGTYGDSFISIDNKLIDREDTLISSLDLFTFVLIKTKRNAPYAIETSEWIDSLEEYSKNLFGGKDFWRIKAEYILTFFSSVQEYSGFAEQYFYANSVDKAPAGEYPFFGEVKILESIGIQHIL